MALERQSGLRRAEPLKGARGGAGEGAVGEGSCLKLIAPVVQFIPWALSALPGWRPLDNKGNSGRFLTGP